MIKEYSKRLGPISAGQFQSALDHFNLGQFIHAEAVPFGLFGQNIFVTSSAGEFVLRGAAHYDWQFPKEQFIARLLHEQTDVPVPWPYLINADETIFGWKHGYVIMPRMPGLQLADPAVIKTITLEERSAIAQALGENLSAIQHVQWDFAGHYDYGGQHIVPFNGGFAGYIVNSLRQQIQQSLSYQNGASDADQMWVEELIHDTEDALNVPYTPVLVLHDYKEANLTIQTQGDHWKVSGVFDLMEALFGDGELDLVRQLASYLDEDGLVWAQSFLDSYRHHTGLRPQANKRLALYMVYERMIVWEYFHRSDNLSQWQYADISVEDWLSAYLGKLERLF